VNKRIALNQLTVTTEHGSRSGTRPTNPDVFRCGIEAYFTKLHGACNLGESTSHLSKHRCSILTHPVTGSIDLTGTKLAQSPGSLGRDHAHFPISFSLDFCAYWLRA
jgi:hypothetical protein